MKKHTKVYLKKTRLDPHEVLCEVCRQKAVDIHHIDARGAGGSNLRDHIENLMALCRYCHNKYGDKTKYKAWLKTIHKNFLKNV